MFDGLDVLSTRGKETEESEQARDIVVVMTGVKKTNKESETRDRARG